VLQKTSKLVVPLPKPPGYPVHPQSLGEHLRKRRLDLALYQRQVATKLGVDEITIVNWEKERTQPSIRQLPKIIAFLGYVPFECPPDPLGRLRYYKRVHGLSYEVLAQELGMDESMVTGWFTGQSIGQVPGRWRELKRSSAQKVSPVPLHSSPQPPSTAIREVREGLTRSPGGRAQPAGP